MIQDTSWGPDTIYDGSSSTSPGSWHKLRGPLGRWALNLASGNSTSTVTAKGTLQGTLSDATAPAAGEIFTISTKGAVGYACSTAVKIARQVRWSLGTLTSTSSTAPTLTVKVCGTL